MEGGGGGGVKKALPLMKRDFFNIFFENLLQFKNIKYFTLDNLSTYGLYLVKAYRKICLLVCYNVFLTKYFFCGFP